MDWFIAALIFLGLCLVAFFVLVRGKWPIKIKLIIVFLLFSPVLFYVMDYQISFSEHKQDCVLEGGLKVLIEPKKANQIHLAETDSGGQMTAEGLLKDFYPSLKEVFFMDKYGKDKGQYFVTSVKSTADDRFKRSWTFEKVSISAPPKDIYVLKREITFDKKMHRQKKVWSLSRDGNVYAKITNFYRSWPKIRYPDAVPGWSCRVVDGLYHRYPKYDLTKLILQMEM